MIEFEIIESADPNAVSPFKFFQNMIYFGKSSGDIVIKDPHLRPSHLMIEVIGTDLLIHPQKSVESYLINGKRSTTIRKVKSGDLITFGKTTLKIVSFEETPSHSKIQLLDKKLNDLVENNSPRLSVIEKLTQLMK